MFNKMIFSTVLLLIFLFIMPWSFTTVIYANDMEYDEIQDFLDNNNAGKIFSFDEFVNEKNGTDIKPLKKNILTYLTTSIKELIFGKITNIRIMLSIIIIAAIFRTFASAFRSSQISEAGFYITFLFLFGVLSASFNSTLKITSDCMKLMLDFMKVLLPTYTAAVTFSTGASASIIMYEGIMLLITFCDSILIKYIIPLVKIFLLITLVDCIRKESLIGKLGEFLATIIKWILKSVTGIVIAAASIQGITVPSSSKLKQSLLYKTTNLLPVIGDALSGAAETVLGVGSLLKNTIGAAGIIALIILVIGPFIEIVMHVLIYKAVAAIIQPVSDNRIINCVNYSAEASLLLLRILVTGAVLFLIVIAVIAVTF